MQWKRSFQDNVVYPNGTTRNKGHVLDEHDFVVDSMDESDNNNSWIVPLLVKKCRDSHET